MTTATADVVATFAARNQAFAAHRHAPALRIIPSTKTLIIGCVDPRVDPVDLFGLEPGEVAVLRNVGGRITPSARAELAMLRGVARAGGGELGAGWNLIVLHHTDCGITRIADDKPTLAAYFGVGTDEVDGLAIADPHRSVVLDIAALRADPAIASGFLVSGLVYDVATGLITTVVAPAPLRAA